MTQQQMILGYIRDNGSITALEAMQYLGVMRLASRINDIRQSGVQIQTISEKGVNRFGKPIYYTRYSFPEEQ